MNAALGQNVISMFGYKCETQFPAIKQLEAYWEGLRMGRLVPQRSEIDPRGIEQALEYTFIMERIAPGLARFRLSGMHLNDLLGMDVRGMPFTSFFTPDARKTVTDALEMVFDGPQVAELTLRAERRIGKPAIDAKVLLLPLRSDMGEITRILGCLISVGPIGRAPRRFDVSNVQMKALTAGHASKETSTTEFTRSEMPETGFTEPRKPSATDRRDDGQKKGPNATRPTLRLVTSDD